MIKKYNFKRKKKKNEFITYMVVNILIMFNEKLNNLT